MQTCVYTHDLLTDHMWTSFICVNVYVEMCTTRHMNKEMCTTRHMIVIHMSSRAHLHNIQMCECICTYIYAYVHMCICNGFDVHMCICVCVTDSMWRCARLDI